MSDGIPISLPQVAAADRSPAPGAPPLRLWPGVLIVVLEWLAIVIPAWLAPVTVAHMFGWMLGPIVATLALLSWWLFASRLPWSERWFGVRMFLASALILLLLSHKTVGIFGLILHGLPAATTAWVVWLAASYSLSWPVRRNGLAVVLLLAFGAFTLVRIDGTNGALTAAFRCRWSPTTEEQFLADAAAGKIGRAPASAKNGSANAAPLVLQSDDWPGFRGPRRDGRLSGVRIATDWSAHPPKQLWRHRVGPGWSSFAVVGDRVFTQEQRGENEVVVCYDAASGGEVWAHADVARFDETLGGPGPRATPTFFDGRIYALGAKGKLNCLDAASGQTVWSHAIAADAKAREPVWGFSSSPLVAEGIVSVFAGGADGKSVLGYRAETGELAWAAGEGLFSYCSLQPARLCGVEQLVIATERGLTAFAPAKGEVLWEYKWLVEGINRVAQPAIVGDSDVLIGTSLGQGTRRVHLQHDAEKWTTELVWSTRAIKPYFNDFVIHGGCLYGFDNNYLTCVSLEDGKGKWREEGYGNGQALLLADQNLLLVLSEKGEVALVDAVPEGLKERAKFQAIQGKTWNHPVIAYGKLFVRNGEEAACYELAPAEK